MILEPILQSCRLMVTVMAKIWLASSALAISNLSETSCEIGPLENVVGQIVPWKIYTFILGLRRGAQFARGPIYRGNGKLGKICSYMLFRLAVVSLCTLRTALKGSLTAKPHPPPLQHVIKLGTGLNVIYWRDAEAKEESAWLHFPMCHLRAPP